MCMCMSVHLVFVCEDLNVYVVCICMWCVYASICVLYVYDVCVCVWLSVCVVWCVCVCVCTSDCVCGVRL